MIKIGKVGRARPLRPVAARSTVVSALVGFLPLIWLSLAYGWGLAGIWSGLSAFVALRVIFVGWRALGGRSAVTGTA